MTISVPNGMRTTPPDKPEPCCKCGKAVYEKGKSGYYDVCDDCEDKI